MEILKVIGNYFTQKVNNGVSSAKKSISTWNPIYLIIGCILIMAIIYLIFFSKNPIKKENDELKSQIHQIQIEKEKIKDSLHILSIKYENINDSLSIKKNQLDLIDKKIDIISNNIINSTNQNKLILNNINDINNQINTKYQPKVGDDLLNSLKNKIK